MLEDMGNAGVVVHRRPEGDGKEVLRVVVIQVQQPRAGFDVCKEVGRGVEFGDVLDPFGLKAVQGLVFFYILSWGLFPGHDLSGFLLFPVVSDLMSLQ